MIDFTGLRSKGEPLQDPSIVSTPLKIDTTSFLKGVDSVVVGIHKPRQNFYPFQELAIENLLSFIEKRTATD